MCTGIPSVGVYLSPSSDNACSWYRSAGPWSYIAKHHSNDIHVSFINTLTWPSIASYDILFLPRAFGPLAKELIEIASRMNIHTWIDYDDNLFSIPKHNKAYNTYMMPVEQSIFKHILSQASLVTTTNKELNSVYSSFSSDCRIIPNAADPTWFTFDLVPDDKQKVVSWRGSSCHLEALRFYAPSIIRAHKDNPNVHWVFQGFDPYFITEQIDPQYMHVFPWANVPSCFYRNASIQPDISYVLLNDTAFDRGHSNIAWIEAAVSNSMTVAPSLEHWNMPGIVPYSIDDPESLYSSLSEALSMPTAQRAINTDLSRKHIQENLTWKTTARTYVGYAKDLMKKKLINKFVKIQYANPEDYAWNDRYGHSVMDIWADK